MPDVFYFSPYCSLYLAMITKSRWCLILLYGSYLLKVICTSETHVWRSTFVTILNVVLFSNYHPVFFFSVIGCKFIERCEKKNKNALSQYEQVHAPPKETIFYFHTYLIQRLGEIDYIRLRNAPPIYEQSSGTKSYFKFSHNKKQTKHTGNLLYLHNLGPTLRDKSISRTVFNMFQAQMGDEKFSTIKRSEREREKVSQRNLLRLSFVLLLLLIMV